MKKIILFLFLGIFTTFMASADDDKKYLAGAVPEVNGIVTFEKSFKVKDKSDEQIYQTMLGYLQNELIANAIDDLRTRIVSDGKADGVISARIEEYMLFKKKPLYLDRTRIRYQINISTGNGAVKMTISQISYYYSEDMDGTGGITYKAEEWITDKEAINKAGTKLYPRSGKFRKKTIDRMEAIFEGAMDAFEDKTEPKPEPEKKKRSNVIE